MSQKVDAVRTTIKLSSPIHLAGGILVEELKVREPLVKDIRVAGQQGKTSEEREIIVAALCCGLVQEDMDLIKWKDYQQIQRFLFGSDSEDGDTE
ncbi:Mu-like prophage FluMu protein gp41 [Haemophilus sputorum HK 2154]|uniref:phage tail assembly protein n=1 Tax=Haemophilus sputorum TaxID=1078480 RepID=UPI0002488BAB|nr:phage tail assembly protein [Haemophilus sputorum]EJP29453.1 Mu-like prophage FluMu protein gp41 [Haemophilus sputorum HK 2154]